MFLFVILVLLIQPSYLWLKSVFYIWQSDDPQVHFHGCSPQISKFLIQTVVLFMQRVPGRSPPNISWKHLSPVFPGYKADGLAGHLSIWLIIFLFTDLRLALGSISRPKELPSFHLQTLISRVGFLKSPGLFDSVHRSEDMKCVNFPSKSNSLCF